MSRYENMEPLSRVYRGQLVKCLPHRRTPSQSFKFTFHMVEFGERIDLLSARYIGASEDWHEIADVNPEYMYFGELQPGTVLRIPDA